MEPVTLLNKFTHCQKRQGCIYYLQKIFRAPQKIFTEYHSAVQNIYGEVYNYREKYKLRASVKDILTGS
jgi:hypothetical protein